MAEMHHETYYSKYIQLRHLITIKPEDVSPQHQSHQLSYFMHDKPGIRRYTQQYSH